MILRPLTLEDADAYFNFLSDCRVSKYMGYSTYSNIDQAIEWIKSILEKEDELVWTIILKEENIIIGACGIKPSLFEQGYWEVGYNLHYDYWNNGYCTEAIKALINSVYEKNKIKNFFAYHAQDNPRSGKVLKKCGFNFYSQGSYSKADNSKLFKGRN